MAPMQRPPMQMARPVIRPPQYAFRPRVQGNSGYYTQPRVVPGMNLPGSRGTWVGATDAAVAMTMPGVVGSGKVIGNAGRIAGQVLGRNGPAIVRRGAAGASAFIGSVAPSPGNSAYDALTGTRYYRPPGFSTQTTTPYMIIPKP